MSRYYRVNVECKGLTEEQLDIVMTKDWERTEEVWMDVDKIVYFVGEGNLYGGTSESEAHEQIVKKILEINKDAKVLTRWVYLENLPFEEYGSLD